MLAQLAELHAIVKQHTGTFFTEQSYMNHYFNSRQLTEQDMLKDILKICGMLVSVSVSLSVNLSQCLYLYICL